MPSSEAMARKMRKTKTEKGKKGRGKRKEGVNSKGEKTRKEVQWLGKKRREGRQEDGRKKFDY